MTPFESFDGYFFRVIFRMILGVGLFGFGFYAAVKFADWKRAVAVLVAMLGTVLFVFALIAGGDVLWRICTLGLS